MVYRFMSEHRDEYTIRETGMSFRGQQERLLPVGEGGVRGAEGRGWGTGGSDCPDTALKTAFANRKAQEGLLFHSDQGVGYYAKAFRETLGKRCPPVRQSMKGKGNCWDKACAESFFKTLKRELETLDDKHGAGEVRQSVFMYLEAYYNRIRMHSILDYVAPDVFNCRQVA
jgi:transposase InsO family protein